MLSVTLGHFTAYRRMLIAALVSGPGPMYHERVLADNKAQMRAFLNRKCR